MHAIQQCLIMQINKITWTSVGADKSRHRRFIGPQWLFRDLHYFVKSYNRRPARFIGPYGAHCTRFNLSICIIR